MAQREPDERVFWGGKPIDVDVPAELIGSEVSPWLALVVVLCALALAFEIRALLP